MRPSYLQKMADSAKQWGNTQLAGYYQDQYNSVTSGATLPYGPNRQRYTGFLDQNLAQQRLASANANNQTMANNLNNESTAFTGNEYQLSKQALDALTNYYAKTNTAGASDAYAKFINAASSVPWMKGFIPDSALAYAGTANAAAKDSAVLQIARTMGSGLGAAPATGLHIAGIASPEPSLSPDARWDMVNQMYANLMQKNALYGDWQSAQKSGQPVDNVPGFYSDWQRENPTPLYQSEAGNRMPLFAGMSQQHIQQLNGAPRQVRSAAETRNWRSGVPYKLPGDPRVHVTP